MFRPASFIRFALIPFAAAVICGGAHAEPGTTQKLRVGAVLALTGAASSHGSAISSGVEFAADKLRGEGWEIDLAFEDDQTNPAKTVSALQSLRSRGHSLFIGPTWSFQVEAVRPIVAAAAAVAVIPATSADVGGGSAKGMFYLVPQRSGQTGPVTEWLKRSGAARAFIFVPSGGWGDVHTKVYRDAAAAAGIADTGSEIYDYGIDVGTFKTLLLRAMQRKADLIMTTGGASDMANLIRARNELKLPLQILGTDTIWQALEDRLIGPAETTSVFAVGLLVQSGYREEYRKRYGAAPRIYSDYGYDSLMILAEAARETDGSPAAIDTYLKDRLGRSGASGPIDFDGERINAGAPFQVLPATGLIQ